MIARVRSQPRSSTPFSSIRAFATASAGRNLVGDVGMHQTVSPSRCTRSGFWVFAVDGQIATAMSLIGIGIHEQVWQIPS